MKILITGGSGKLGKALKIVFPTALVPTHEEFDVTNYEQVLDYLIANRPEVIIHAAAMTGIRQCEDDQKKAWNVNVNGTKNIVRAMERTFMSEELLIYISTACVFSGNEGNYSESSLPYPRNFYSFTKYMGELATKEREDGFLIVRTNFVPKEKWPYPGAFTDRLGTYLFADDVAEAIKDLVYNSSIIKNNVIHICGEKTLSMFELAKMTTDNIIPMTLKDYQGPHLTMNMTLKTIHHHPYKISEVKKDG